VGICDTKAILNLLQKKRVRATVSAFGYGAEGHMWGGCDQEFLGELASLGEGNYAYVKDPDDALAAFGKELGGLLSTYATGLNIEVDPVGGHQIKSVVTDVPYEQDVTGTVEIPLSDIMAEETRHFVMEVELGEQKNAFPRASTVFNVGMSFSILTEEGTRETRNLEAKAKVRFVKSGEEQTKPNKDVDEIVALAQVVRTQLEAEKKADAGDHVGAAQLLGQFGEQLQQNGYAGHAHVVQNMANLVADRGAYVDSAGYRRSMARGATRAYAVSSMDSDAALHLADCHVDLSNSAMDGSVQAFTETVAPAEESPEAPRDGASSHLVIPSDWTNSD
jgi:Ca-activated chloride channel family protein